MPLSDYHTWGRCVCPQIPSRLKTSGKTRCQFQSATAFHVVTAPCTDIGKDSASLWHPRFNGVPLIAETFALGPSWRSCCELLQKQETRTLYCQQRSMLFKGFYLAKISPLIVAHAGHSLVGFAQVWHGHWGRRLSHLMGVQRRRGRADHELEWKITGRYRVC